jgi:hypothetical protein
LQVSQYFEKEFLVVKLRDIAKETRDLLQGNCGWVVLYKNGRRWEYTDTFCCGGAYNDYAWKFDCEAERQELLNVLEIDHDAIILNGFAVGLDDEVNMSIETLTEELKSAYLFDDSLKLVNQKEDILNAKVEEVLLSSVEEESTEDVEETQKETSTKFNTGMRFGKVEISKRTDKMVYLKSLENGLRTKKKIKTSKDGVEHIDIDIGTCEWLGITQDEEFFKHTTFHPDKYRNELVYRLFPKGGEINE